MLYITPVQYEDKIILQNLIQLYRHDSSEYDGHELNDHGLYLYKYLDHQWTDEYRHPLLVKVDDELAGFVLLILNVPEKFVKVSTSPETNVISDFFILRKFRGRNYGKQVAFQIFNQFPGAWEIRQTRGNIPANRFWNKVIKEYTEGSYNEIILDREDWNGPIQTFKNN
ncbi:GNAT family N-acetyltransferase [Paenibacillus sp. J5C_2022]|uniref:GNAT family N-acetyltransferase n=1 Tax=Paenibacillus sp. J5C2022 TaxID=2977129 RepID=UPI0021D26267|nr:GNAT family N-acetyltransferase [Paenibacillus sp. J5C2022]MCU6713242.1 GNAT family N-acetyltransferase [Paenibacillus sp. J5C2022]